MAAVQQMVCSFALRGKSTDFTGQILFFFFQVLECTTANVGGRVVYLAFCASRGSYRGFDEVASNDFTWVIAGWRVESGNPKFWSKTFTCGQSLLVVCSFLELLMHVNSHCGYTGTLYCDRWSLQDKENVYTSHRWVLPTLTLPEGHTSHMHKHTHTHTCTHTDLSLQVTSMWVCLVNMPSLPSQVQGECGAFIRLIKGRGQICP